MHNQALQEAYDKVLRQTVRDHQIAIAKLTEEQTVKIFRELIMSGDIVKYITEDERQELSYIPYRRAERLQAHVVVLEDLLRKAGAEVPMRPTMV